MGKHMRKYSGLRWPRRSTYHDHSDGEEDPVAMKVSRVSLVSPVNLVWFDVTGAHNNWGSLWIVCTGT